MVGPKRSALGTLKKIYSQDTSATADQWPFSTRDNRKRKLSRSDDSLPAKRLNAEPKSASPATYCPDCNRHFSRPYVLNRHLDSVHSKLKFVCDYTDSKGYCGESFPRQDNLSRHRAEQHEGGKAMCWLCGGEFRKNYLPIHQTTRTCYDHRVPLAVSKPYLIGSQTQEDCVSLPATHLQNGAEHKFVAELEDTSVGSALKSSQLRAKASLCELSDEEMLPELEDTSSTPSNQSPHTPHTPTIQPSANLCSGEIANDTTLRSCEGVRNGNTVPDLPLSDFYALHELRLSTKPESRVYPLIVPDSPRPVLQEDYFSSLMLDTLDEADLVQQIRGSREELYRSGSPVRKQTHLPLPRLHSEFLRTSDEVPRRFYQMTLGSECAMCKRNLGSDKDGIFNHAKEHLIQHRSPSLRCPTCKADFAFELDLRLHSSRLEIWSFCREIPVVESHGEEDWLAKTAMQDREAFIALLRQWERLQLHWYAASIDKILSKLATRLPVARPSVSTSGIGYAQQKAKTRPCASAFTVGPSICENTEVGQLTTMFNKMSVRRVQQHNPLRSSSKRIKEMIFAQHESREQFFTALRKRRRVCTKRTFHLAIQDALHEATLAEDEAVLGRLLRWQPYDDIVDFTRTTLADVDLPDEHGFTALQNAANCGLLASVTYLIDAGAKVDPPEAVNASLSALDLAAANGHCRVAKVLLEKGAFVDRQGPHGKTALMHAAENGHEDVVVALLQHGADIHVRDASNRTALDDPLYDSARRLSSVDLRILLIKVTTRGGLYDWLDFRRNPLTPEDSASSRGGFCGHEWTKDTE